jgi:hypothetical protein
MTLVSEPGAAQATPANRLAFINPPGFTDTPPLKILITQFDPTFAESRVCALSSENDSSNVTVVLWTDAFPCWAVYERTGPRRLLRWPASCSAVP